MKKMRVTVASVAWFRKEGLSKFMDVSRVMKREVGATVAANPSVLGRQMMSNQR